jgi:uncharacterized protein YjbI with pentapeptide repeats
MKTLLRSRPSASMVVAAIALFISLGGTSIAAIVITGKNVKNGSLTGADIKNESVRGNKIQNGSLGSSDVIDNALTGTDVKNESLRGRDILDGTIGPTDVKGLKGANLTANTLTGDQIDESKLGTVPSAATAGGVTPKRFSVKLAPGAPEQQILDQSGLQLFASCPAGVPAIRATTSVIDSAIVTEHVSGSGASHSSSSSNFDPGTSVDLNTTGNDRGSGTISYVQPTGAGVSAVFGFDGGTTLGSFTGCVVSGTAFGG